MKLTIDRFRWLRGEGAAGSRLLRTEDGKMCCLGFHALACGATETDICDVPTPSARKNLLKEAAPWLYSITRLSFDASELIRINDTDSLTDAQREGLLTEIFARNGVEVEFV